MHSEQPEASGPHIVMVRGPERGTVLPLLLIVAFPFLNFLLGRIFEGRRWANSDYAPSTD